MPGSLLEMIERLQPDPWRSSRGFSPDLEEAQQGLFEAATDEATILSNWLQRHQPCLFGRAAAKLALIRYCILHERDLISDTQVCDKIQEARRQWTADAFYGRASGFVLLLVSPRISKAIPSPEVLDVAHRL